MSTLAHDAFAGVLDGCFVGTLKQGRDVHELVFDDIAVQGNVVSDGSSHGFRLKEFENLNGLLNGMEGARVRVTIERIPEQAPK